MNYCISAVSDIGIKKKCNQDSALVKIASTEMGDVVFAILCDGMGGLTEGEVASVTVIKAFSDWFSNDFAQIYDATLQDSIVWASWDRVIQDVNSKIVNYGNDRDIKIGTTMVALLLFCGSYYVANIGDSRAYLLDNYIAQLTKDQSFVQREMDLGRMTKEEAKQHINRNVLLQCIGVSKEVKADYYSGTYTENSMFLLCSDGFRHQITEDEIFDCFDPRLLKNEIIMQKAISNLIDLNKKRLEEDNITAVLIRSNTGETTC